MILIETNTFIDNFEYKTSDLGLASALVSMGYTIVRLDKISNTRVNFVFIGNNVPAIATEYWTGNLQVDAKKYFESVKSVKSLLHNCN